MIRNFGTAFRDSLLFMNARWNFIRSTKSRILLWVGIVGIFATVFLASNTGHLIRYIAQGSLSSQNDIVRQYAITYLESYTQGDLGLLVSGTLGVAIISVFISPFTGTVSTSLIPSSHIVSVRRDDKHRFTDSIFTQFFSSISLLQLLTLTTVASLVTIDGDNKWGMIYAWASWPVLVFMSIFFLWGAEYLYRKFGEKTRLIIVGLILSLLALAVTINPDKASTIFGLGDLYSNNIRNFDEFSIVAKVFSIAILFGIMLTFSLMAFSISKRTLNHPDVIKEAKPKKRKSKWTTSPFYMVEMTRIMLSQIWRNSEMKKPIIATIIFGAILIFATDGTFAISSTFVIIVPIIVAIAWGSNFFGVIGQGFVWMSSQPYITGSILWIAYLTQFLTTSVIYSLILLPSIISGRVPAENIASIILAFIAVTVVMTRSAIDKAVHNPFPVKAGIRGESLLPPATIISYTLRFALWSGQLGLIVLVSGSTYIQLAITFMAIVWSLIRMARLNAKWHNSPELRNKVLLAVNHV